MEVKENLKKKKKGRGETNRKQSGVGALEHLGELFVDNKCKDGYIYVSSAGLLLLLQKSGKQEKDNRMYL